MTEDKKPLDEKQLVARRKQIDDKRVELQKLEDETPKFYLGRPVTIIAETHPSRQWTIRFDDTGETESVQKHQVTDSAEPPVPAMGPAEARAAYNQKVADEKAKKNPTPKKEEPATATPVKEWFKK